MPSDDTDNQLASKLANKWVEEARGRGFRQCVIRLHARQAQGQAAQPGEISRRELAKEFETTERNIRNTERRALAKVAAALTEFFQDQAKNQKNTN